MKVAIIDYGAGNLPSVERALQGLGAETERATEARQVDMAKAIVLPGVGHFSAFVAGLRERNLTGALRDAYRAGVPILGICLGLQALYDASEEAPELSGLALIHQTVCALPANVKLPHMGWNQLCCATHSRLLDGIASDAHFYFAHSYAACAIGNDSNVVATCCHGRDFAAVIERKNIHAVQFHPEKSGQPGAQLLANFLGIAKAGA